MTNKTIIEKHHGDSSAFQIRLRLLELAFEVVRKDRELQAEAPECIAAPSISAKDVIVAADELNEFVSGIRTQKFTASSLRYSQ